MTADQQWKVRRFKFIAYCAHGIGKSGQILLRQALALRGAFDR